MRLKESPPRGTHSKPKMKLDSTTMPLGERQCNQNQNKIKMTLNDTQRSRLFGCICVARHLNGASDCDETFDRHVYDATLELMQPHLCKLDLIDEALPYPVVEKVWIDFIRTGLVVGRSKSKLDLKISNRNREESLERNRKKEVSPPNYLMYAFISLFSLLMGSLLINALKPSSTNAESSKHIRTTSLQMHYDRIDKINGRFPSLLTKRKLNTIKTRTAMMQKEVSILMLIGRHRDVTCKADPTYCVGKIIANMTQYDDQYGYIDAASSQLTSEELNSILADSLDDNRAKDDKSRIVMVDNLSQLPGDRVMHLFQFIDKDEYDQRRGLLILMLYTEPQMESQKHDVGKMNDASVAERVLLQHWSPHIPSDTLTSVISRTCRTIVRIR